MAGVGDGYIRRMNCDFENIHRDNLKGEVASVAEKPIIFSAPMVQALFAGRKTQTRRVIKPRFGDSVFELYNDVLCETEPPTPPVDLGNGTTRHKVRQFVKCKPKYNVGDILWVRETWCTDRTFSYLYRADAEIFPNGDAYIAIKHEVDGNPYVAHINIDSGAWKPSIHMPREAARLFLRVIDVRVERVQEITEADAIAEGCAGVECDHLGCYACESCMNTGWLEPPQVGFSELWNNLNAKRGYGWDANPWVWVYSFELIE